MTLKRTWLPLAIAVAVLGLASCQPSDPEAQVGTPAKTPSEVPADTAVVQVTVEDYSFLAPPQLRSGWTTFRMTNKGEEPHFMLLYRLPEGKTFGDYAEQVSRPFAEQYGRYISGEIAPGVAVL